ncbi:MAG: class I SAM-dependent methyltransferase [Actinomycetota bacterium]|nr:class I SAM-dependent methyltransferase [Actinomycetota bacterium]
MTQNVAMPAAPLSPRASLRWPLIKRAMQQVCPASTLEVGCGQGAMGARLVALTESLTAIEPDADSCEVAAQRIRPRGGTVVNCATDELPAGQVFELVSAFEVLEHIEDDSAALQDWRSRVAADGHLLLSVPAWQHLFGPSDTAVGHFRRYSPDQLTDLLRRNGFEPVWVKLYGWPLTYLLEAVRNKVAGGERSPDASVADQTARSGRWLQPSNRLAELAVRVGILPFQGLQRLAPRRGNGIVALARRV